MKTLSIGLFALWILTDLGFSQASGSRTAPRSAEAAGSAAIINRMDVLDNGYRIGLGDFLSFRVVEETGPILRLRVQDSGEIEVPNVGLVKAAGRTCKQVAFVVKEALEKDYLKNATVIITLDSYGPREKIVQPVKKKYRVEKMEIPDPQYVTIFGQVGRQGKLLIPESEELTISGAILQAGGFAQFAKSKAVEVLRKVGGTEQRRRIIVNVDAIMRNGDLDKDIILKSGDVVIVKEKLVNF